MAKDDMASEDTDFTRAFDSEIMDMVRNNEKYSDEVMMDVTDYLDARRMTPREYAKAMIKEVFETTGITATAGIGTNLYLCKIALDITAKHSKDFIGELDEESYQRTLWHHRPLTDIWNFGKGIENRLKKYQKFHKKMKIKNRVKKKKI